jgi:hypothetical protein
VSKASFKLLLLPLKRVFLPLELLKARELLEVGVERTRALGKLALLPATLGWKLLRAVF